MRDCIGDCFDYSSCGGCSRGPLKGVYRCCSRDILVKKGFRVYFSKSLKKCIHGCTAINEEE